MDGSYNEESILQEIQRFVTLVTSENITHADMSNYNMSKHQIISYSRNINLLLNVLKNSHDLPKQVTLEILNIIYSIISIYQTSIDLEFILSELIQIEMEDLALVHTLGKSIAFISEYLFLSDKKKFVLPVNESRTSISPLEAYVFENFLDYFSVICSLNLPQYKEISETIKTDIIQLFVKLGINLLANQPLDAVAILRSSLFFGIDQSKQILKKVNFSWPLEFFNQPEIFQCLSQIAVTGPDDAALDALEIVKIISKAISNSYPSYGQLVDNIQKFILAVLDNASILDNQAKAIEIQNLLIYTNPESKEHPFDDIIQFLFQFSQTILQDSPLQLTIIYPGILTFFRAFKGKYCKEEFYSEFKEGLQAGLAQYIDSLLNSFESNTEQTVEEVYEIQNLEQIIQSLKRLLEFSDLRTIHSYIKDKILEIVNDEITVINSFKISFILVLLNSCYIEFNLFPPEGQATLFDLLFDLLPIMQDKLPQYSQLATSTNTSFYIAEFFLQAISTLLIKIFINIDQSKVFNKFREFCTNSNVVKIISNIFDFLLFMIQNDFETPTASFIMKDILKSENLCQRLASKTNLPNYFMENYALLPLNNIYSFALIKLVYPDPQKREAFFKNLTEYLSQLIESKSDQSENYIHFFETISTFFDSFLESGKWFEFFEYIFTHFGEYIEKESSSSNSKIILEFISKLTENKDGGKHLPLNIDNFPTTSPYTFQIFKFFCLLLTNVLKNLNLNQIESDESVFASSIQTSDIYLNSIKITNEVDDDEWHFFSKDVRAMNFFLISPFPKFDIMRYYNDTCLIEYYEILIQQVQKTTPTSLLSIPYVLSELLTFIRFFSNNYHQDIFKNEPYLIFILDLTRIAFLSSNFSNLNNACITLDILNRNINSFDKQDRPNKNLFNQHYILALNLLSIPIMEEELSKISESSSSQSEKDSSSEELDSEILFSEVKKNASSFIYAFLYDNIQIAEEINARIVEGISTAETQKEMEQVLNCLIYDSSFTGTEKDKERFDLSVEDLISVASKNSFRLDYLPTMKEFFIFK